MELSPSGSPDPRFLVCTHRVPVVDRGRPAVLPIPRMFVLRVSEGKALPV